MIQEHLSHPEVCLTEEIRRLNEGIEEAGVELALLGDAVARRRERLEVQRSITTSMLQVLECERALEVLRTWRKFGPHEKPLVMREPVPLESRAWANGPFSPSA